MQILAPIGLDGNAGGRRRADTGCARDVSSHIEGRLMQILAPIGLDGNAGGRRRAATRAT